MFTTSWLANQRKRNKKTKKPREKNQTNEQSVKEKMCAQKDSRFNRNSSSVNIEKNILATITSGRAIARGNYEANHNLWSSTKREKEKKEETLGATTTTTK